MNNMAKQMEMFDEGGLMDEGGTVDPVSGNDVPPGSNQEEVRDDIPAQLSEGEFVFPADVVRFIGLEKLMMIRQRAKAGLQRMDDMGQMGNSEEAVMPDDLPFSIEDLDMEDDELEMAQGGVVHMANGGTYNVPDPSAGVYYNPASQPTTGVAAAPMKAASSNIARSIPIAQAATPLQAGSGKPTMFTDYELPQAPVPIMPQRDDLPAFLGEVTPGISGVDYVNEVYENEAGETKTFRRYTDDRLLDENGAVAAIPEGYTIKSEAEKDVGTGPVKVETATVQDDGDGGDNDGSATTGASVSFGGTPARGDRAGLVDGAFRGNLSFTGIGLGGVKGFLGSGFSSLTEAVSGGKMGNPLSLSGNQGAIISNIIDPSTKSGVGLADTLGFNLSLNADQYNKYITRSGPVKVTDRQELADIVKELSKIDDVLRGETLSIERAGYLAESIKMGREDDIRDSIEKGKGFDKSLSDALGRDRGKVSGSGIFGTNIGGEDRTGAISAAERAEMTASEKAASKKAVDDYVNSMMGGQPADDDEENEPGGDSNNDNNNNDGGRDYGGGIDDAAFDAFGDFAKGGLAKQMKRSGLASKK